jgi:hypothetical protein
MTEDATFQPALENYRYGVTKVLPGYVSGRFVDLEALTDEIALILDSRDALAKSLAESFRLMQSCLDEIDQLDQQLLQIKDDLLQLAPAYTVFRNQASPPRSQWWYYLDEIVSTPPAPSPQVTYWLPLTSHSVAASPTSA